jgi:hypothetical protein
MDDKIAAQEIYPQPPPYYTRAGELLPPPIPTETTANAEDGSSAFHVFGELHSLQNGIPLLQVSPEFVREEGGSILVKEQLTILHARLAHSIDELFETLVSDPSEYARKVEHVGLIFRNMQYLINMLRPIQAKVSLQDVLRQVIQEKETALEDLEKLIKQSDGFS